MTKPRQAARFASLGLMILAFCIPALAQSNKGTVVGTVKDPNDALVAKAVREIASKALLIAVAVHVSGIVAMSWRWRENLVAAMLTGRKRPVDRSE